MSREITRRDFLSTSIVQSTLLMRRSPPEGGRVHMLGKPDSAVPHSYSANDQIQLALIGAGNQGQGDTKTALQVPGVKLVAAADCYDGRLTHCREMWGNGVLTMRDYREILARSDVDAVLIA